MDSERVRCGNLYEQLQDSESDLRLLFYAVTTVDVPMMDLMFEKVQVEQRDEERILLSAVNDMYIHVVTYLLDVRGIRPSMRVMQYAMQMVTHFVEEFETHAYWPPAVGVNRQGSDLNAQTKRERPTTVTVAQCVALLRCHAAAHIPSDEEGYEDSEEAWQALLSRLGEVAREMETYPDSYRVMQNDGPSCLGLREGTEGARCRLCSFARPTAMIAFLHGDTAHSGVCMECSEQLHGRAERMKITPLCPFCRQPIEKVIGIFSP